MVHLGVQSPLGQRLLQIVEKTVGIECRLGIGAGQKLVKAPVRNAGSLASCHREPPGPLWPPAHGNPDTPVKGAAHGPPSLPIDDTYFTQGD